MERWHRCEQLPQGEKWQRAQSKHMQSAKPRGTTKSRCNQHGILGTCDNLARSRSPSITCVHSGLPAGHHILHLVSGALFCRISHFQPLFLPRLVVRPSCRSHHHANHAKSTMRPQSPVSFLLRGSLPIVRQSPRRSEFSLSVMNWMCLAAMTYMCLSVCLSWKVTAMDCWNQALQKAEQLARRNGVADRYLSLGKLTQRNPRADANSSVCLAACDSNRVASVLHRVRVMMLF